jgi:hypothetical protein
MAIISFTAVPGAREAAMTPMSSVVVAAGIPLNQKRKPPGQDGGAAAAGGGGGAGSARENAKALPSRKSGAWADAAGLPARTAAHAAAGTISEKATSPGLQPLN